MKIPCEDIKLGTRVNILRAPYHGTIIRKRRHVKDWKAFSMECGRHVQMNYKMDVGDTKSIYYHAVWIKEVECRRCIFCTDRLLGIRRETHESD